MPLQGYQFKQYYAPSQLRREVYVNTPPGWTRNTAVDVLVALHGGGGDYTFVENRGIRAAAEAAGMLLVAARGVDIEPGVTDDRSWHYGGPQSSKVNDTPADDVQYIDQVLSMLGHNYNLTSRRFICGMSTGACMTYRVACESRYQWTGAITHSGTKQKVAMTPPAGTCPLLHIHGDSDTNVPFAGGGTNPIWEPVQNGLDAWAAQGNEVMLRMVAGGAHQWFTMDGTPSFDSTGLMMSWIAAH